MLTKKSNLHPLCKKAAGALYFQKTKVLASGHFQ
jgi:hypothetical protein